MVALGHTLPGVILATNWANDTAKMVAGWMLLTSVTLVYAAICMDGEEQARLSLVLAGPVWVWFFVVCISQGAGPYHGQGTHNNELEGQCSAAIAMGNSCINWLA